MTALLVCSPTQELRGLGVANLFGAAFNCYTTTGSFSRSAVMDSSGAKSQLAGIVSAIVVMFVLLFLTPVFKNMPQNVLGAIVISAIISLFNYSEWFFLWKVRPMHAAPCSVNLLRCHVVLSVFACHPAPPKIVHCMYHVDYIHCSIVCIMQLSTSYATEHESAVALSIGAIQLPFSLVQLHATRDCVSPRLYLC